MEKEYLIRFNEIDQQGNLYKPGCITNLKEKGLAEDEIGVYKP